MSTILQINASLFSDSGQSSQLARQFVAAHQARHPGDRVVVRDLAADPIPHLDAERFGAFIANAEARTPAQQAIVAQSDALIAELKSADIVVLGLPMYNFGIPSQLKAWFDHIARAGVSFRYTANGPEGLIGDRKVYVFAARGGLYRGTPRDTQTGHVRDFFNLLGIRDLEFVYAEGLNIGEAARNDALSSAQSTIDRLAT